MTQNEMSAIAVAVFVGFALLRGLFRMLRNLGKAGGGTQAERIDAAAQRILKQRKSGRSSVPLTQRQSPAKIESKGARASSTSQQRQHAQNQPTRMTNTARPVSAPSTPAVIRRGAGLLSGAREPVIQRRR